MPRTSKNSSTPTLRKLPMPNNNILSTPEDGSNGQLYALLSEKYDNLNAKLDSIIERMDERDSRLERVEQENAMLRDKITKMEERLDEADMVTRRNNLVLSGGELSRLEPGGNSLDEVTKLLKRKLNYVLTPSSVVSAYRMGVKPSNQSTDRRNIMLRLASYEAKVDILSACRTVKPADMYANDDLTPSKASLLYLIRSVKKKFPTKITACGSSDGRLYLFLKPPDSSARNQRVHINSLLQFNRICEQTFGGTPADLLQLNGD